MHGVAWRYRSHSKNGMLFAFPISNSIKVLRTDIWEEAFELLEVHTSLEKCLGFSPDSQRLAAGSRNGTVRVWDMEDGGLLGVVMSVANDYIWCVALSPNGQEIVSASDNGVVLFWNFKLIEDTEHSRNSHNEEFGLAMAMSGDGKQVLARCHNPKFPCSMWNALDGRQIKKFETGMVIYCVEMDHSG
eukprot:IDg8967t1